MFFRYAEHSPARRSLVVYKLYELLPSYSMLTAVLISDQVALVFSRVRAGVLLKRCCLHLNRTNLLAVGSSITIISRHGQPLFMTLEQLSSRIGYGHLNAAMHQPSTKPSYPWVPFNQSSGLAHTHYVSQFVLVVIMESAAIYWSVEPINSSKCGSHRCLSRAPETQPP
jgi:hypothetical protein